MGRYLRSSSPFWTRDVEAGALISTHYRMENNAILHRAISHNFFRQGVAVRFENFPINSNTPFKLRPCLLTPAQTSQALESGLNPICLPFSELRAAKSSIWLEVPSAASKQEVDACSLRRWPRFPLITNLAIVQNTTRASSVHIYSPPHLPKWLGW